VRGLIEDGTLGAGSPAPSGAELARISGYSVFTCRAALADLLADGTLRPGLTGMARLRVPRRGAGHADTEALRAALSRTLASLRHAAQMTQPDLAAKLGVGLTAVSHAETGRIWQSREFWEQADALLGGDLLRTFGEFEAAAHGAPPDTADDPAPVQGAPVLPVSVTITPDGVAVTWPDGTQTLARPPGGPGCPEDPGTADAEPRQ
jgi:DNA-binding XRE family transcriptional regulator